MALMVTAVSCARPGDTLVASSGLPLEEALDGEATLLLQPTWSCIRTPRDLAGLSTVVVRVEPVSDETRLRMVDEQNGRTEWRVSDVKVLQVLSGDGVASGEVIRVGRTVQRRTVWVNGVPEERRIVGPGYPGPLTGAAWVLGIGPAPHSGEAGVWVAVAGTHGRIALDGSTEGARVLAPQPGYDGQLQAAYAGAPLDEVASDLASPTHSLCQDERP